jgi:signal transduction histidine kinase
MASAPPQMPSLGRSLSARLLVLTTAFVMLAEVLIYVPSAARFRLDWLQARLAAAEIAVQALLAAPDFMVSPELEERLLKQAGARTIVMKSPTRRALILGMDPPVSVDAVYDLRRDSIVMLIAPALTALVRAEPRLLRVIGAAQGDPTAHMDVLLDEAPLAMALRDFSWRILSLSVVISLFTAGLVFFSLHRLMVRPMRQLTLNMVAFRARPEDASRPGAPTRRQDEIGIAETELARMQQELRAALAQKTRLAALGVAVSKISHDLRNILATAQLVSDRLAASDDPRVRQILPRLVASIDRAIALCTQSLKFGRAEEPPPRRATFALAQLVDEVREALDLGGGGPVRWRTQVENGLGVDADRDQLFRVLVNLGRNAVQAMDQGGEISVKAWRQGGETLIDVADTGGGLSRAAREHLFEPFLGGARAGGTGLGLAIARDLLRAHGGDIELAETGPQGTRFRLRLPAG